MIIHKIPIRNNLRNYFYILADNQSKEALVIDPLAHKSCLELAAEFGYNITQVLNTHHHHDHIGGNDKVINATGAKLLAHSKAVIANVDQGLNVGDIVHVGRHQLSVLDTPGHTMSHVCLFYAGEEKSNIQPALFSGDTLFNAGVGHCFSGGHPEVLFNTITTAFDELPENTRLYPGHDYIENNLRFTLDREPSNSTAKGLLTQFSESLDAEDYTTTLGLEKKINVFMRLQEDEIRNKFAQEGVICDDDQSTFIALREVRNQW